MFKGLCSIVYSVQCSVVWCERCARLQCLTSANVTRLHVSPLSCGRHQTDVAHSRADTLIQHNNNANIIQLYRHLLVIHFLP